MLADDLCAFLHLHYENFGVSTIVIYRFAYCLVYTGTVPNIICRCEIQLLHTQMLMQVLRKVVYRSQRYCHM